MKHTFIWKTALLLCLCLLVSCACAEETLDVDLSLESGFYPDTMELEITCNVPGTAIYYTTDGSRPDSTDKLYDGPLSLTPTTNMPDPLTRINNTNTEEDLFTPWTDFPSAWVIRAAAVDADGEVVDTAAGTFFIGYDRQETYGDLPIISLMIEEEDFFSDETGIYVLGDTFAIWDAEQTEPYEAWQAQGNFSNSGREWERPVTVDFLMAEGDSFSQNMGVRIKGGTSRSAAQKSLRLIAREEYGKKNIKYPLFPDNICEESGEVLEKYKSVTLRNGGNDRDNAKIRDPFISRLADGMEMETAGNRPVIGFINGQYWGLYTLNEEYNDNYIQHHYGIDNENVIIMKNGELKDGDDEGLDEDLFWELFFFIEENDMSDPEMYAQACEMMDMKSFADYVAVALYIINEDGIFQDNNWMMWRVRDPEISDHPYADGKWRMMLFDTDYSSDVYGNGQTFSKDNVSSELLSVEYEDYTLGALLNMLMASEEFRTEVIYSLMDVRNLYFTKDNCKTLLKTMTASYKPYVNDTFMRFGPNWVAKWSLDHHFSNNLHVVEAFFQGRYDAFPGIVANAFQLETPMNVNIKVSGNGSVILNNRESKAIHTTLETKAFQEYPLLLTAVPDEGATFVGWQVNNQNVTVSDPAALSTEVWFATSFAITAQFE
ncbi:MAG: CotH kinase family protein [Clostridia bacterium]|nr:CotH kinase family protein [Clostridia bacterium]